jgi:peptidoglycan/LPS O-acetylase OafA/YrhL
MVPNLLRTYAFGLGNAAFWSLGLEEQLYLLYALFLLLRCRLPARRAFLLTLSASLLWNGTGALILGIRRNLPGVTCLWELWPFGLWSVWILGAVAAEANANVVTLPAWCYRRRAALACAALGVLFQQRVFFLVRADQLLVPIVGDHSLVLKPENFWILSRLGDCAFAVSFFIVLNRWARAENEGRFAGMIFRWLAKVGLISYSLYLTHLPVIRMGEVISQKSFPSLVFTSRFSATAFRYAVYVPCAWPPPACFSGWSRVGSCMPRGPGPPTRRGRQPRKVA